MLKNHLPLALAAALLLAAAVPCMAQEAKLLDVLKSNASVEEKAAACRELSHTATKSAVPALAALLDDEKLAHMARYAMETIPDPSADAALRDALGKLKGRLLVGVIGSLGARRDAKAVAALAALLADADADVAQSAARSLGSIGTPQAAKALEAALADASGVKQLNLCEGLFRCAEAMAAKGQGEASRAVYDCLKGLAKAPQQVRVGALRGAILSRGKEGIPLLIEAVRGSDYLLTTAAARTALELPGAEVTAALAAELPKLPADKQVLIVNTLGHRGDASAGPALLASALQGPEAVRLAAINNLTHLGHAPALPLLAEMSLSGDSPLAAPARACLTNFPGKDADAAIAGMLAHRDAKVRALAVEMIGQRSAAGSAASLVKAADDAEASVRVAALKALRDQAGLAELPPLLKLLVKARSPSESQAAESALAALCARQSEPAGGKVAIVKAEYGVLPEGPLADVTAKVAELVKAGATAVEASNGNFGDPVHGQAKKLRIDYTVNGAPASKTVAEGESIALTAVLTSPAVVDAICGAMGDARGEAKLALVRAMRSAGGGKALQAVQAAAADSDPQVKETALRALCEWSTPDALPLVAELVKTAPSKTLKVLALRGFVRLVPQQNAPNAKKIESLKEALGLAERDEEKRLVLSALGNVTSAEALSLVASHLESASLKDEACLAAVAIAEKLTPSADVAEVMKKVAKQTTNRTLAARANAIARKAKR